MLSLDRRRALGLYLWVAVAGGLCLYLHSVSYLIFDESGDALMTFFMSTTLGYVAPVMPLMAALPFGTAFCADWHNAYAPSVTMRSGKRRYLRSKALACALSGGLASALGMLAFIVFLHVKFPADFAQAPFLGEMAGLETLLTGGGAAAYASYYVARLLLAFLSGTFWALTALTFSAFYPNVALTLCAPLVMHRLLQELGYWVYYPAWLNVTLLEAGMVDLPPALVAAAGVGTFGVLFLLLALAFDWRAGRRLRYA